jgi:hypothetical protein
MRPWQFLSAKPVEGWKLATAVFFFSWGTATLLPLFLVRTPGAVEHWALWWLSANWAVASCFVFATFTNLTRLADRVRQLEESGASARQSS